MKLPIRVSEDSKEPIYHQIEQQVKALIISGKLQPDTALPSIRALAHDLGCSVITTRRAYQDLETGGFIKTIQGKGTFVHRIDPQLAGQTKKAILYEALQQAVELGKQMGYSPQELRELLEEVLRK